MRPQNILAAALSFVPLALAHIPHLDDGTHVSIATAWPFPDPVITRVLMLSFDCPSVATYSKVSLNDSSVPLTVGIGIPNITALYDYRPSLWAIGKTVVTPPEYQTDTGRDASGIPNSAAFKPVVPREFNAVEYPTEGSGIFAGFREESSGISGFGTLSINVTASELGDVYLVFQPLEHRRGRAFISLGTAETATPEEGSVRRASGGSLVCGKYYSKDGHVVCSVVRLRSWLELGMRGTTSKLIPSDGVSPS